MVRIASSKEGAEGEPVVVKRKKRASYLDFWAEAEKPFSERKKIRSSRSDEESPLRKYHLTSEQKQQLISEAAATGGVVNPLKNRVGAYWGGVEALIKLGVDEWHSMKSIATKMEEIMSVITKKKRRSGQVMESNAWTDFAGKESRDGASKPKNCLGRIEQNFKVLQRLPSPTKEELNAYGVKLAQFGMCIDIEYRQVAEGVCLPYVRLNTTWPHYEGPDGSVPVPKPVYSNPISRKRKVKAAVQSPVVPTVVGVAEVIEAVETLQDEKTSPERYETQISVPPNDSGYIIPDALNDFEQQTSSASNSE